MKGDRRMMGGVFKWQAFSQQDREWAHWKVMGRPLWAVGVSRQSLRSGRELMSLSSWELTEAGVTERTLSTSSSDWAHPRSWQISGYLRAQPSGHIKFNITLTKETGQGWYNTVRLVTSRCHCLSPPLRLVGLGGNSNHNQVVRARRWGLRTMKSHLEQRYS